MSDVLTDAHRRYLATQKLARLATVAPDGQVQNRPVVFFVNADGTIDIGGYRMASTKKFRNVAAGSTVALVIDDLKTVEPWAPRALEIRGHADALSDVDPPSDGFGREIIRIHPGRIYAFGLDD